MASPAFSAALAVLPVRVAMTFLLCDIPFRRENVAEAESSPVAVSQPAAVQQSTGWKPLPVGQGGLEGVEHALDAAAAIEGRTVPGREVDEGAEGHDRDPGEGKEAVDQGRLRSGAHRVSAATHLRSRRLAGAR